MQSDIQKQAVPAGEKERVKLCVHDLTQEQTRCAACGRPYDKIDYATAVSTGTKSTGGGGSVVTTTYYRDFTRRTGGYCRICDAKQRLKTSLIVLACGLLVLVTGILLVHSVKSPGAPIILVVAGGFTVFFGFVSSIVAIQLRRGSKDITPEVLCNNFLRRLKKDGLRQPALRYFTPEEAKKLIRTSW